MNISSADNIQNMTAFKKKSVNEDLIAVAIAEVIETARSRGQSLEDLTAEVMADDRLLDQDSRRLLSDIVIQAWNRLS
ncbi:MAG: hypothetical protein F6K19_16940 [Cyanothece sp. SIO1E1]|nr:hypothetical protein [Cyanothece sp. SIO1E1]